MRVESFWKPPPDTHYNACENLSIVGTAFRIWVYTCLILKPGSEPRAASFFLHLLIKSIHVPPTFAFCASVVAPRLQDLLRLKSWMSTALEISPGYLSLTLPM